MTRKTAAGPLREYRMLMIACLVMVVVVAVYWQTFSRMMGMWSLSTYEHGWLVFPVALYVLWRRRAELANVSWDASSRGVALTTLLVAAWIVARTVGVQLVEFASATLLIFAVFWSVAGTGAMRSAAFPLLLLLAAVPAGEFLVEPLMRLTAAISAGLLGLVGVPVLRDGQFFALPGGTFEVADVCAGLRYLLAGLMAGLAYAYVTYTRNGKRVLFVGIVAIVLVITNGVRAFIVMYVASATDMQVFAGKDHVYFGMVLFAIAFLAMIWFGEKYADPPLHRIPAGEGSRDADGRAPLSAILVLAVFGIIVAGPAFDYAKAQRAVTVAADSVPPALEGCTGPHEWSFDWSPDYRGADSLSRVSYTCGDHRAGVYMASYRQQQQGKELVSSVNRVWPVEWRRFVDQSPASVPADGAGVDIREVLVRDPAGWRMIWYWYLVGDAVTGSEFRAKLLHAQHTLALRPVESSILVVIVSGEDGENAAVLREQIAPQAERVMEWSRTRTMQASRR